MAMCQSILIKPHHFVDILRTLGGEQVQWKPHPYGHDEHGVAARLLADRDVILQVELGADDICKPCIHNVDGCCDDIIDTSFRPQAPRSKQAWNLMIDRRWCRVLGLTPGQRISAKEFCEYHRRHIGQMPEIYQEVPQQRVAARAEQLRRGIVRYLGNA